MKNRDTGSTDAYREMQAAKIDESKKLDEEVEGGEEHLANMTFVLHDVESYLGWAAKNVKNVAAAKAAGVLLGRVKAALGSKD